MTSAFFSPQSRRRRHPLRQDRKNVEARRLVLAPPAAAGGAWIRRFGRVQTGFASCWMQVRGNRRRRNIDCGFVVFDHADWPALLTTIAGTGASRVIAMHGNGDALTRLLRQRGTNARTFARDGAA